MSFTKVSVIIPVYNSEKYLSSCIEELVNQEFNDYELVFVNDGSTDNSSKILAKYEENYDCIKVIEQENAGMCSARNHGIREATGEYICFCDNDDLVKPGWLKDNYELAEKYDADIVKFLREVSYENNGIKTYERPKESDELQVYSSNEEIFNNINDLMKSSVGVWCGMYRRAFLIENDIFFDETFRFGVEDYLFNVNCYDVCEKLVFNKHIYYEWCQRDSHSSSKKFHENYLESNKKAMVKFYEVSVKHDLFRKKPGAFEDCFTNSNLCGFYERMLVENCTYSSEEKTAYLKKLRELEMFNNLDINSVKAFKNINFPRYLILKLFLNNHHKINLMIMKLYLKKMGRL